jgi:4-amino-4-deoxy-L-arabinose transferase-like glycosyltransferase
MGNSSRAVLSRLSPFLLVLMASALAWVVLFVAVPPPRQDFPLNDDWAFGRGAMLFAGGEGIHYSNWASMPQLGQWLWACPFVWLLGPSFFTLRSSTIVLSWLGLWGLYDLLQQQGWPAGRAVLACAVMAFHPLFFCLQGTFMTDVPALSLALIALAFYGRALRSQRTSWLAAAVVVAVLAAISRQNTVAVPLVIAFLLGRETNLRRRPLWWLGVFVPVLVGVALHFWFQGRPDIIPVEPRLLPPPALLLSPYVLIHWCGLTTLPLLLLHPRGGSWRSFVAAFLVLGVNAAYWFYQGPFTSDLDGLFPYTGTVVSPWGAGTGDLNVGERPIVLGDEARAFLTLLGCVGGALFVVRSLTWKRRLVLDNPLLLFSLSQIPFVLIAPNLWDRYLLPLLAPGALVLAGTELPPIKQAFRPAWRRVACGCFVLAAGVASVGMMHDWLAWNAAAWDLGQRAVSRGIDPLEVEGGMEWDGWHAASRQQSQRRLWRELFISTAIKRQAGGPKGLTLPTTRVWFPQVSGRYALSFTPLPDAVVVDSEPYRLWLLAGERRMYLLHCTTPNNSPQ